MARKTWRRKDAETYLRSLGRRHHINIRWLVGRDWHEKAEAIVSAAAGLRLVRIPRPNNARQFLVALHEFGHILGPLPDDARLLADWSTGEWKLASEGAAWGWAMEHIPVDLDLAMTEDDLKRTVGAGLSTHAWTVAHEARH